MPTDPLLERLFANNAQWAADVEQEEPGFFSKLAEKQEPKVLWIGCSDSRVPESVLTVSRPGDIFVHRNIANQFPLDDDNALSVLTYAVDHIGVSHIVLVGHTQCGGAATCHAIANSGQPPAPPTTPLERWLAPLIKIAIETKHDPAQLVEANVHAGVQNLTQAKTLRDAWARGKDVTVHGWVFELEKGRLRDLGISFGREDL